MIHIITGKYRQKVLQGFHKHFQQEGLWFRHAGKTF